MIHLFENARKVNLLLVTAAALWIAPWAAAQEHGAASAVTIEGVRVGVGGQFKVGHWTPVVVELSSTSPVSGTLTLVAADGDGLSVRYKEDDPSIGLTTGKTRIERYVKFGRTRPELAVEFVSDTGVKVRRDFNASELPEGKLSTSEFIVRVGEDIGLASALANRAYRIKRPTQVIKLASVDALPGDAKALQSIDLVVLPTSQIHPSSSKKPLAALRAWLLSGGRAVILCGRQGEALFGDAGVLADIAPGEFDRVASLRRTAALETFAGSSQRLGADLRIEQSLFSAIRGQVVATEEVSGEQRPLIVNYPVGFGQVTLITVDLDQPPLHDWSGRSKVLARVLAFHQPGETGKGQGSKVASPPAQLGYQDLAGQLRMSLDQFSDVQVVAFSWVAGLIAIYILLIGPADYFFLRYGLKRMQATWLTLAMVSIAFVAIAWWINDRVKAPHVTLNQAAVIDIDLASGVTRGIAWTDLYSPQTSTYDLVPKLLESEAQPGDIAMSWHGQPGAGLGGLDGRPPPVLFDSPYVIGVGDQLQVAISAVPVQTASTKSFVTQWSQTNSPQAASGFTATSDGLIVGKYTYELPFELTDGYIAYDRFLFKISGPIKPGRTLELTSTSSSRNLLYQLTQKQVIDAKEIITPWNPRSADADRILEIMMLHKAAGGDNYTGLTHRYYSQLDLSDHLITGRALLIGRTPQAPLSWKSDTVSAASYDRSVTMVRIVLPIAPALSPN